MTSVMLQVFGEYRGVSDPVQLGCGGRVELGEGRGRGTVSWLGIFRVVQPALGFLCCSVRPMVFAVS